MSGIGIHISERAVFPSTASFFLNWLLLPLRMAIPQPLLEKIPGLLTNYDVRTGIIKSLVRGTLIDIGCGTNRLVHEYRASGGEGKGVDVYDWGDVDILVEDSSKLPCEDGSVDTVTFVACLNHIPNRVDVLKEARRILKPDGQVILTNLRPTLSRIWHAWAFWDDDQHERGMAEGEVYGFTDAELTEVLRQGGFEVLAQKGFSWGLNHVFVCRPLPQ